MMYKTARIRVNGTLSRYFKLSRGTWQGDPLTSLVFILAMEPLAENIKNNHKIKGIQIGQEEHKMAMYADDVILYLTNPTQSHEIMDEIQQYSDISGYKLNTNKSEAMIIGQPISQEVQLKYKFKWEQNKIKYLGVVIPKDLKQLLEYNFGLLENNLKQDLNGWLMIPFTITGRLETIKMNILPRFIFLFQNLPILTYLSHPDGHK